MVAPAGPVKREALDAGLRLLQDRYRLLLDDGVFQRRRYLAGDDPRRRDELTRALSEPSVQAVFAARGGYGAMRLLPALWAALQSHGLPRKAVIGFSDVTAVHLAFQAAGRISIHGPTVTQLGRQPPGVVQRLFDLLESSVLLPPLHGTPIVAGVAEGPLVGGNLSLLTRLLGTPYLPALEGTVLLLEDVGERPYRLDRMWTHLRLAGVFEQVRGLALGDFIDCEEPDADFGSADVLATLAGETGLPCVRGLTIGHGAVNMPVALGGRVRLDAGAGTLAFLEPAVASPAGR